MVICFVGHSYVSGVDKIETIVREEIRKNISGLKEIVFYLGFHGSYDYICARICQDLKKERPDIQLIYVTPYLTLNEQEKIKDLQKSGLCDTSVYPPIENTPPKFAISKRNEWMIANSELIIAFVSHRYGGAYSSLQFAKRKKKKIINVFELL